VVRTPVAIADSWSGLHWYSAVQMHAKQDTALMRIERETAFGLLLASGRRGTTIANPQEVRLELANRILTLAVASALTMSLCAGGVQAQSTLRIAMTAADVPATTSQPDSGFEGNRFVGLTLFDALTMWDLSSADKASTIIPGLATEWQVDAKDRTKWIFKLRRGVKFHDGTDFNADAVVFNVEKVLAKDAAHYDARLVAQTMPRMPTLAGARKVDDYTVELSTSEPDAFLPINLSNLFMASPTAWAKSKSWVEFAKNPVGTGPWKFTRLVPRERLELVRNTDYWNKVRVPKSERLILIPMPEATTRVNALLSNQVDWIEAPPPDAIAQIKSRGFQVTANPYPHTWPWQFSFRAGHAAHRHDGRRHPADHRPGRPGRRRPALHGQHGL
jgi:peptide/nickel transport system substrate-binding protein